MVFLGPLFTFLGWTGLGPQAASLASWLQSLIGSLSPGSVFSIIQSAQMGGYGVAIIERVFWFLHFIFSFLSCFANIGKFQAAWTWMASEANSTICL
ncbi:hypothetical protein NXS19_012323 [Fusarium pseudograminearum]|nr:hypothetical protein NXS19_012323 [Fusarium pseudograminearum]